MLLGFSNGRFWHSAMGQRYHWPDTGSRHQAPAYVVIPDDGQQATVQDADLLAEDPPDNEQRFDQHSQMWEFLDKLLIRASNFHRPHHAHLETKLRKVAEQGRASLTRDSPQWGIVWRALIGWLHHQKGSNLGF
jgi:hypothetical protein